MRLQWQFVSTLGLTACLAMTAGAAPFTFSTGRPNGLVGTGSRPGTAGTLEIESADDFILGSTTSITHAAFYGLLPAGLSLSDINQVRVEIYRVFPNDSVNPPSGHVPTRANSPSDVAFEERDSATSTLSFTTAIVDPSFTVANSVLNGIFPSPNQTTHGEGPVTGEEVLFDVVLSTPLFLPADHYFFIPQVGLNSGNFLWLSAPKPTVPPFTGDLQSWIRNENLAPDWLRVGTDVIGSGTFNAAFSISGDAVPEPGTTALLAGGLLLIGLYRRTSKSRKGIRSRLEERGQ